MKINNHILIFILNYVSRFRNMVESTVILKKRPYGSTNDLGLMGNPNSSHLESSSASKRSASHGLTSPTKFGPDAGLYDDMDSGLHQRYVDMSNYSILLYLMNGLMTLLMISA